MRPIERSPLTRVCALVLCLMTFLTPDVRASGSARMGVITGDGVNLRAGPGVDTEKVGRLSAGQWVTILESQGSWFKVSDEHGVVGWVFSRWVDEVPMKEAQEEGPLTVTTVETSEPPPAPPPLVQERQGRRIPWLWIGAAGVAGGVLAAVLSSREEPGKGTVSFRVEFP